MTAIIPCKTKDGFECPYIKTCLARLTDKTITGCGMALYINGFIKYDEIGVQHTVKENTHDRKSF